jgi:hypothetical protein
VLAEDYLDINGQPINPYARVRGNPSVLIILFYFIFLRIILKNNVSVRLFFVFFAVAFSDYTSLRRY